MKWREVDLATGQQEGRGVRRNNRDPVGSSRLSRVDDRGGFAHALLHLFCCRTSKCWPRRSRAREHSPPPHRYLRLARRATSSLPPAQHRRRRAAASVQWRTAGSAGRSTRLSRCLTGPTGRYAKPRCRTLPTTRMCSSASFRDFATAAPRAVERATARATLFRAEVFRAATHGGACACATAAITSMAPMPPRPTQAMPARGVPTRVAS